MTAFFNGLGDIFNSLKTYFIELLPDSPFSMIEKTPWLNNILGYVNYFVPIDMMLGTLGLWLSCIGTYYLVMVILRWMKVLSN